MPATPPFLLSDRVALRPLTSADLDGPYLDWFNDADVCRHNRHHVYPYTREAAEAYLASVSSGPDLVLAVTERRTGEHIGNVSLQDHDVVSRTAEFAVVIGSKGHWGQGYAFEAASLVFRHGFDEMNLHRIGAGTSEENEPMCRLATRLGMVVEGRRRSALFKSGRYHDVIEYGILASEFRRAQ